MSFGKKIIGGMLWSVVGMSGRTLICFVISILVARNLGVEQYGIYAAVFSLIEILVKFTEMGVQSIFSNYIPRYIRNNQYGECSYVTRLAIGIRTLLLIGMVVLLRLVAEPLVNYIGDQAVHDYIYLASVWFLVLGLMNGFYFIIIANLEMKFFAKVEIVASFVQLFGVLYLINMGISIDNLIILMIIVNGIQLVCYGARSLKILLPKPVKVDLKPIAKFGLIIWLSTIFQYFRFKSIDILMILFFLDQASSVAYYDIAYLFIMSGGYILLRSIDSLMLPIFSESYAGNGLKGLQITWEFLTKITLFLSVPIMFFLFVHSEMIIRAFYTDTYIEAASLIKVFAFFILGGLIVGSETTITLVFPLNKEKIFLYVCGINGVLNIIFNVIFIPQYGVMGAVYGTGGAMLATSLISLGIAVKLAKIRLPYEYIAKILMIIVVAISWTLGFQNLNIFEIICIALIYGMMTTFLLLRFYQFNESEKELLQQFNPKIHKFLSNKNLLR